MTFAMLSEENSIYTPRTQEDFVSFSQGLTLREIEKAVILETLKRQNFNRTRAARTLGIGIRTLQRKLKQYRGDHSLDDVSMDLN